MLEGVRPRQPDEASTPEQYTAAALSEHHPASLSDAKAAYILVYFVSDSEGDGYLKAASGQGPWGNRTALQFHTSCISHV